MFTLITYIPGLISLFVTYGWSCEIAFLYVYLPVLLLLPQIFVSEAGNLPHLAFAQTAIIPIGLGALINRLPLWRFGLNDILFLGYLGCFYYSELNIPNEGGYENLKIQPFVNLIFPYFMAKLLIHPTGNSIAFAKCFVTCIFTNILLSAYELRFSSNPYYHFFASFFPNTDVAWITLYRFGFVRFAGPFIQTILMGIGIATAFLLHTWLWKNRLWPRYFKKIPIPLVSKRAVIGIVLIFGMLMTFSRGPLVGLLAGMIFLNLGYTRHLAKALLLSLALITVGVFYTWDMIQYYLNTDLGSEISTEQLNAAYRVTLIQEYWDIALEKPWWGWGSGHIPLLHSMRSIDNQYLWLFLRNGGVIVLIFISMIVINMMRLFIKGIGCDPVTQRLSRSLAFTLFSIYITLGVSLASVYMGMQIEQIFFILLGWSDSFIVSKTTDAAFFIDKKKVAKRT